MALNLDNLEGATQAHVSEEWKESIQSNCIVLGAAASAVYLVLCLAGGVAKKMATTSLLLTALLPLVFGTLFCHYVKRKYT